MGRAAGDGRGGPEGWLPQVWTLIRDGRLSSMRAAGLEMWALGEMVKGP